MGYQPTSRPPFYSPIMPLKPQKAAKKTHNVDDYEEWKKHRDAEVEKLKFSMSHQFNSRRKKQ